MSATGTGVPMVEQVLRGLDYEVMSCANIFAGSLTRALENLVASMETPTVERTIVDLVRLALQDLEPSRAGALHRPEGAKYLVRRRR